ncbi:MAG: SMP-30/gluconolactonase/LRE family protein [Bdellovibrionia bacterium]
MPKIIFILFFLGCLTTPQAYSLEVRCFDQKKQIQAEVFDSNVRYPESPLFEGGALYFVEYARSQVIRFKGKEKTVFWKSQGCGPAAISALENGEFLVSCYDRNSIVKLSKTGEQVQEFSSDHLGFPFRGPNDFTHHPEFGIYFTASGEFHPQAPVEGKILHLSNDGFKTVATGIHYANGLAISDQGRSLLVSEHLKNRILRYEIKPGGLLSDRPSVFADLSVLGPIAVDFSQGLLGPDGLRVDDDGRVYVAHYGGAQVLKLSPSGELIGIISISATYPNITNLWIHGSTLYLSAVQDSSRPGDAGLLFSIHDPHLASRKNLVCQILE